MIGRLRGVILEKQAPLCVIDVSGVGYEVFAPMTTFYHLPDIGGEVELFTHFVVREDAQQLYGFYHVRERSLFRELIKVSGVGPKLALTILSGIEADQFAQVVHEGNAAALVKLPGVGKKTAERLVIEMRDRLKDWELPEQATAHAASRDLIGEATSALIALGYKPQDASKMVSGVGSACETSEELIRLALQGTVA